MGIHTSSSAFFAYLCATLVILLVSFSSIAAAQQHVPISNAQGTLMEQLLSGEAFRHVSTLAEATNVSTIQRVGFTATLAGNPVAEVPEWVLKTTGLDMVSGIICRDELFGYVYVGTNVVLVLKAPTGTGGTTAAEKGFTSVRSYSLGNRWATHCFFKNLAEVYIPMQVVLGSGILTYQEASELYFLVLNRMSGEFMRFEMYNIDISSRMWGTHVIKDESYFESAEQMMDFLPNEDDASVILDRTSENSDSDIQGDKDSSADYMASSSSSSSSSYVNVDSGSSSDNKWNSSSGSSADDSSHSNNTEDNSTGVPPDYLGVPVNGATADVLGIWPFRYGDIGIVTMQEDGDSTRLNVTMVHSPLYALRQIYKQRNNLTLLYACGFTNETLGQHKDEEDATIAAASWDILELQESNVRDVLVNFSNGTYVYERVLVSMYNYAYAYKLTMSARCSDCILVKILAVDDNSGMAALWRSEASNAVYATFFRRIDIPKNDVSDIMHGDVSASTTTTSSPSLDPSVTTTTTTTTTTEPPVTVMPTGDDYSFVEVFDSLCNVTLFVEDEYTLDLYVVAVCPEYRTYITRLTRENATLTAVETVVLSYNTKVNPFVPVAASPDYTSRTFDFLIPLTDSYALYEVALFGVYSMDPTVVDGQQGTNITLTGYGLTTNMSCVFPSNRAQVPVHFYNKTTVSCAAPGTTYLTCDAHVLQVSIPTTETILGVSPVVDGPDFWQFNTPVISAAVNRANNQSYGFLDETNVRVTGTGFFPLTRAPRQLCRLWSPSDPSRVYLSIITFISSTEVWCTFPSIKDEGPLQYPSQIDVSLDGQVFSPTYVLFPTYGTTVAITATSALRSNCTSSNKYNQAYCVNTTIPLYVNTSSTFSLSYTADSYVYIDPIRISFIDSVGHQELTNTSSTIRILTATLYMISSFDDPSEGISLTDTTLISAAEPLTSSKLGAYVVTVADSGTALWDDLVLRCPLAGEYVLSFSTTGFEDQADATSVCNVSLTIFSGSAYRPLFAVLPSTVAHDDVQLLEQQPVVAIVDVCNNTLPCVDTDTVNYVEISVEQFNHSAFKMWNLTVKGNLFYATNVSIHGPQTDSYNITLRAVGLPEPGLAAEPIYVAWCEDGYFAIRGNGTCIPCPLQGICNGTDIVLAKDGYWHRNAYSISFVACSPPYGSGECLPEGGCVEGHGGIACKRCESGYRKIGYGCKKCPSKPVSNFLSFLIVLAAVVLCVLWVACMTVVSPSSVHITCIKSIVYIVQVMSLFFYMQFPWPVALRDLFSGLASMTNIFSYAMSCSFKNDSDYVIFIFIFPISLVIFCTVVCRFLVLIFFDRVNPVNMSAMVIVAYTHRRRLLTEEAYHSIASGLRDSDQSEEEEVSDTSEYSEQGVVYGRRTSAAGTMRSGRSVNTLTIRNTRRLARSAGGGSVADRRSMHGGTQRSIASTLGRSSMPFAHSEVDAPGSFEDLLIATFEQTVGRSENVDLVENLAKLGDELQHDIKYMRLALPSLHMVRDWVHHSTLHRSKAIGNPTVLRKRNDKVKRVAVDTSLHQASLSSKHTALGSITIPLRLGHSIEEQYRAEAVRQFRRSWIGIMLNTFATVFVVFYMIFLVIPLMWQRCDTLVEGLNNENITHYSYLYSTMLCDATSTVNLRNTSRAILVIYGVAAPFAFLAVSLYYRARYGLDVMYAAFPLLYYNSMPCAWWQEYSFFLQKYVMAIIFTMCKAPLLQAALAVWIQALRFLYDLLCMPHETRLTKRTPLQFSTRVMTLLINTILFVMLNVILLVVYIYEEVGTLSIPVSRFLSALVIICFSLVMLVLGGYVLWEVMYVLLCLKRARKTAAEVQAEKRYELSVLCHMYKEICTTSERYLKMIEEALRMALELDEKARNKNKEDRFSDHDSFSSLLETPSQSSNSSNDRLSDMLPTNPMPRSSNSLDMSLDSDLEALGRRMHNNNNNRKDVDALSCGVRADFSFLSDHPSFAEPEMVAPVANPDWLPLQDGEEVTILDKTGTVAGKDLLRSVKASSGHDANMSVVEQFDNVKKPRPQPPLHRCDSLTFSIRNLPPPEANNPSLTGGAPGASIGFSYTTSNAPSGAANAHGGQASQAPALSAEGAPPNSTENAAGATGATTFDNNLTIDMEALLAAPIPDVATHFDPFAVPPLPVQATRPRRMTMRTSMMDNDFSDEVQEQVQLLGDSMDSYRALAEVSGVDAEEAQSLLQVIAAGGPLNAAAKGNTDSTDAATGVSNRPASSKASHATVLAPGEANSAPSGSAEAGTDGSAESRTDTPAATPPPLPTFHRPVEKVKCPPPRRKVHPKHKKVVRKKPKE